MTATPVAAFAAEPLAHFRESEARVATVSYRLAVGNRAHCEGDLAPQPGFLVRSDALNDFAVTAVVPGSPAETAGLTADDRLLSVNGQQLSGSDSVERAEIIDRELHAGPVTLRIVGRDGVRDLQFAAESGCPAKTTLIQDEAVNAWADGTGILITTGLLALCESDDDLALVLGHEMAHNLLRHRKRLVGRSGGVSGLLPRGEAASQALHDTEEEADRFAVSLAMAAKYDLTGAAAFMNDLLDPTIIDSATHPGPDRRLALLREAIARARRHEGQLPQPLG